MPVSNERTRFDILLVALALSLIVVGMVSHTLDRHLVQIVPILLALVLGRLRPSLYPAAALPICFFWFAIAVLIWLFIFGIARIASGTYSPMERAMTIVMLIAGSIGMYSAFRVERGRWSVAKASTVLVMFLLQFGALQFSYSRWMGRG